MAIRALEALIGGDDLHPKTEDFAIAGLRGMAELLGLERRKRRRAQQRAKTMSLATYGRQWGGVEEACQYYQMSEYRVKKLAREKRLPGAIYFGQLLRFDAAEAEAAAQKRFKQLIDVD
jgi:cystathionine beta-lyase/cystathionine gamma-synthase